jgi:SNF2 family DNA or RNA helicase
MNSVPLAVPVRSRANRQTRRRQRTVQTPTKENVLQDVTNSITTPNFQRKSITLVKSNEKKPRSGRKKVVTPTSSKHLRRRVLKIEYVPDSDEEGTECEPIDVEKSLVFDDEEENQECLPIKTPTKSNKKVIEENGTDTITLTKHESPNWFVNESYAYYLDSETKVTIEINPKDHLDTIRVPLAIFEKLLPHQRAGIRWLHSHFLNEKSSGGILADDMGLGKTAQTAVFLQSVFKKESPIKVVICAPVAVICNWRKELTTWADSCMFNSHQIINILVPIHMYYDITAKKRKDMLTTFAEEGGILITSYGLIKSQLDSAFVKLNEKNQFKIDVIILDEGHKLSPKV